MSFSFVCFYVHKAVVVKLKFERYVPYVFLGKSFACSRVLTNFKLVSRGTEMHGVVSEVGVMYFCMRFLIFQIAIFYWHTLGFRGRSVNTYFLDTSPQVSPTLGRCSGRHVSRYKERYHEIKKRNWKMFHGTNQNFLSNHE